MFNLIMAVLLILSKAPLSGFQFLLLLCIIEIETGFLIGDYYSLSLIFFYLVYRYLWWKTINAPIVQTG